MSHKVVDVITLAGVTTSVVAYTVAVWVYPGGSYTEPHAHHHDLLHNYVCDLVRETAHNGTKNPFPGLARAALLALAVAFASFAWRWIEPRVLRFLGLVSFVGAVLVTVPVDGGGRSVHDAAILLAGIPALIGSFLALRAQRRAGRAFEAALGAVALVVMGITATGFVLLLVTGFGDVALPFLQKLAAALAMAWLVGSSLSPRSAPATTTP